MKQATLIYNPVAGIEGDHREARVKRAAGALNRAGIAVDFAATTQPGEAESLARAAASNGCEMVVVYGGDGTLNEVVNGMAMSKTTLGILPGGTANIAARELGLPFYPEAAARALPRWTARRIALGRATWRTEGGAAPGVRSRYFLNVAGIGFDAHVISSLRETFKRRFGVLAYVAEGVRQISAYSFPLFTCRAGAEEFSASFAAVQRSGRYAGWFPLAPETNLLKSQLTVCGFTSPNRWRYLVYACAVLLRLQGKLKDVKLVAASPVICESESPISFELDGELVGRLPASFELVPDALTVLAP